MSALARDFRLWAALPNQVQALVAADDRGRVSTIARPTFPAGVCTRCGCTFHDPCIDGIGECCSWTDARQNRCTFCRSGVRRRRSRKGQRR